MVKVFMDIDSKTSACNDWKISGTGRAGELRCKTGRAGALRCRTGRAEARCRTR